MTTRRGPAPRTRSVALRRWTPPRRAREHAWLEALYRVQHHPDRLAPDPLQLVTPYADAADREVAGLVAASLAYGNVTAMLPAIRRVLDVLGPAPAAGLDRLTPAELTAALRDFRYRVTAAPTMVGLLVAVRRVRQEAGSLEDALLAADPGGATITDAFAALADRLRSASPAPLDHLLPSPAGGSACKRPFLWLRWVVRRDAIDPGGWSRVDPARLVMPVDTHVARTARTRRWTRRRTVDLTMALELTARLRDLAPDDPLRWDFALTRPGIRATARLDPT